MVIAPMNTLILKPLSILAVFLTILLLSWSGTRMAWALMTPVVTERGSGAAASVPSEDQALPSATDLAKQISDAHLFGQFKSTEVVRSSDVTPIARSNLLLVGVLATGDDKGLALIGNTRGRDKMYAVGSTLPGGAKVVEVLTSAVVIDVDGKLEKLLLRKPGAAGIRKLQGGTRSALVSNQDVRRTDSLASLRDEVVNDPAQLIRLVAAKPVRRDGDQLGYKLSPRGDGKKIFKALGLRAGDVITGVNGVPLESHRNALAALESITQSSVIDLDIERRGRLIQVSRVIQ